MDQPIRRIPVAAAVLAVLLAAVLATVLVPRANAEIVPATTNLEPDEALDVSGSITRQDGYYLYKRWSYTCGFSAKLGNIAIEEEYKPSELLLYNIEFHPQECSGTGWLAGCGGLGEGQNLKLSYKLVEVIKEETEFDSEYRLRMPHFDFAWTDVEGQCLANEWGWGDQNLKDSGQMDIQVDDPEGVTDLDLSTPFIYPDYNETFGSAELSPGGHLQIFDL